MAACRRLAARTRTSWHVNNTLHEACVALHRERIDIIIIYHLIFFIINLMIIIIIIIYMFVYM